MTVPIFYTKNIVRTMNKKSSRLAKFRISSNEIGISTGATTREKLQPGVVIFLSTVTAGNKEESSPAFFLNLFAFSNVVLNTEDTFVWFKLLSIKF